MVQGALNLLSSSGYSDKPLVRWLNKHSDHPLSAGKRWIVERYQFGVAMFDPAGLKARYELLTQWQGGNWVNYWTRTVPKPDGKGEYSSDPSDTRSLSGWMDNDSALVVNGLINPPEGTAGELLPGKLIHPSMYYALKSNLFAIVKEDKKEGNGDKRPSLSKPKKGRHFTVVPKGLGERLGGTERWERVDIEGVEDEVSAHLGLFIPAHNRGYEGFVERVGKKIFEWCNSDLSV